MIKRERSYFLLSVLSVSLVTFQCHGAEIALSPPDLLMPIATEHAGAHPHQNQMIGPLLPDTALYPELAYLLLSKRRDEAIAAIEQTRQENETSWRSVFASASSFYIIPSDAYLPRHDEPNIFANVAIQQRQDLTSVFVLPDNDKLVDEHHLRQDLFGAPYLIWPQTNGHYPADRNISWPLVAEIAFAQDIIHTTGQLTFRTDNRQAELNFGQGSQQINLSFTTSKFLDKAVFDSQAHLRFDGQQYDSLVMIAQLFSDKDELWDLPLWGQFKVLRPDENSPLGGQFSYMPPK